MSADGNSQLKDGEALGDVSTSLAGALGRSAVTPHTKVVSKDNVFQLVSLDAELVRNVGAAASLTSNLQTPVDARDVRSAVALAAFKALPGSASVDASGRGPVININALSQAQKARAAGIPLNRFRPDAPKAGTTAPGARAGHYIAHTPQLPPSTRRQPGG